MTSFGRSTRGDEDTEAPADCDAALGALDATNQPRRSATNRGGVERTQDEPATATANAPQQAGPEPEPEPAPDPPPAPPPPTGAAPGREPPDWLNPFRLTPSSKLAALLAHRPRVATRHGTLLSDGTYRLLACDATHRKNWKMQPLGDGLFLWVTPTGDTLTSQRHHRQALDAG